MKLSCIGVAFNGRIRYGIGSVVFESDMGIRPACRMLAAKVVYEENQSTDMMYVNKIKVLYGVTRV